MKAASLAMPLLALCACLALSGKVAAEPGELVYTERPTDTSLRKVQKKTLFAGAATSTSSKSTQRARSFNEMSDFIVFNGMTTFVPKNAILHLPDHLRQHVIKTPAGELMMWKDFFARNRTRVAAFEVTLEEASGAQPIDPARLEAASDSGLIIVAVIQGFPASVARPQPQTTP